MSDTRQNSGSNAHRATGTPSIRQNSQRTQTGIALTTQVANTTQSESFELFGSLPFELKAKTWNIATREVPRLVEITPRGNFQGHTPALLGVSHIAKRPWKLMIPCDQDLHSLSTSILEMILLYSILLLLKILFHMDIHLLASLALLQFQATLTLEKSSRLHSR
ncbi:hypothetical protein BCIN_04g04650 [Botrytis cinerea B05.10]|uniref:Uncharacterized protein n=1 Tax=Botryotinia fuckeliana (strain B05.10) TaxID=332648 RepID=A0A384JFV9_BOTFB|nr:hypothetical protein BCIN_04g04650 [Botrytis cinerea B05.10]ATZ49297.1 hypothetical protein BCIN_04g04650 [Botrytis cinerea B05.10]